MTQTVIPVLGKLRKEDDKFKASLDYRARFCENKGTNNNNKNGRVEEK